MNQGSAASPWAPLRIGLFRSLWIAALASNVGVWMQTVGAQWLVVHDAHAAILVSLVQTGTDQQYHDAVAALSDPPPETDHYLAADVRQ